jgi:hypothetical protein
VKQGLLVSKGLSSRNGIEVIEMLVDHWSCAARRPRPLRQLMEPGGDFAIAS